MIEKIVRQEFIVLWKTAGCGIKNKRL